MSLNLSILKLRDTYAIKPGASFCLNEFGYYCLDEWIVGGYIDPKEKHTDYDAYLNKVFGFDEPAKHYMEGTGHVYAEFDPFFEVKVLEQRGEHELVQDEVGRHVLYFAGKRDGFMPEYVDHPVKDIKTFMELCEWRLNPNTPSRIERNEVEAKLAAQKQESGLFISQSVVGAYMYLRSLVGPEALLYMFYDDPDLIHALMVKWLEVTDAVFARHQEVVNINEILFDEDICYNHGPLISFDMMREFLFPYYQQLIQNIKRRAKNGIAPIIHLGTDGKLDSVIPIYKELIGATVFSPCEVASGCDVVVIGRKFENIILTGGIDKRILATGKDAIDRHLEYILPAMRKRGGYIPTCDHGVPAEVSFENYMHFRRRVAEYSL